MRGQGHDPEPLALARQHLERRAADRAGRAEDRDAGAHTTPNSRNRPAVTGRTKYSESSTPPWPGISPEESLRPASRLNSDSATSPTCAATATSSATASSFTGPSRSATRSSTRGPYTRAATTAPTTPPTAPAHVFRGDSTGASFGPPSSVPAAIAQVSQVQVTTRGRTTSAVEASGCASLWAPWRIGTAKARRAE